MNLILFEPAEIKTPLPIEDARAQHLLKTLRRQPGDTFDAGLIDGPRGKGKISGASTTHLTLTFAWGEPPAPLYPITLIVGLPRPQTARKILNEATSLGISAIHFVATQRSEPSYAQSTLWSSGEWRRHLITGAKQAFCTRLPHVTWQSTLDESLTAVANTPLRLALDNYEAASPLSPTPESAASGVVALGPERGWTGPDRDALRTHGFKLAHLGPRVLRAETACVAAITLLKAKLGLP